MQNKWRTLRVFVSSTFRDMHFERDELVKQIFPQLRKICESRSVTWTEVDLRWGITQEQANEILPLCLEEVRRCRPFFIGLLGERYGSRLKGVPDEVLEREPWLEEYLQQSLTELEIMHGVFRERNVQVPAFFYFRDPAYLEHLPVDHKPDFRSDTPEAAAKLSLLKDRVRNASEEGFCHLRENYRDPQELGRWLLEDFTQLINKLFPGDQRPEPLDREAADQEAFAESRARIYIGRQDYIDRLDTHATDEGPPLVLLGESGSGKSALLANWATRYRAAHQQDFVLLHFIGSTPHSSDWAAMLRRIMGEFKRRLGITQEIPDQPEALRLAFANWLHLAAAKGRVVLVLDALNQLDDRDGAPDLLWLPPMLPRNVRLVLSTLPGRSLDNLQARHWPTLQINPLDPSERTQLLTAYLAQYSKALDAVHIERITAAPQSALPLYLRALLEELRVFGDHPRLDERIAHYLEAKSPIELYKKILARWETDYDANRNLVFEAMTLLWSARRGLSEAELLEMLGTDRLPLPHAYWTPLYLAAEQAFIVRSGLIGFFHEYLRQAVLEKYLPSDVQQKAAHLRLADYFGGQELTWRRIDECSLVGERMLIKGWEGINIRRIDEQPWQLAEANAWQGLYVLLSDRTFFSSAWDQNDFEVKRYWSRVEGFSPLRMLQAYRMQIDSPDAEVDKNFLDCVALLLEATGHTEEALRVRSALCNYWETINDWEHLAGSLIDKAAISMQRGDLDGALAQFRKSEEICRSLNNLPRLAKSLGGQGLIKHERGDLEGAKVLYKEQEVICRELDDQHGVAISVNNQAMTAYVRGDLDEAMALYQEEARICRLLGDLAGLQHSLGGQANVIQATGHLDGVMQLYKEQERICRQLGNRIGIAVSLGNQAVVLKSLGNLGGAMALHREEERICRDTGYLKGLAVSLGNQALVLKERGEMDAAMDLLKESEHIQRQLADRLGLATSLGNRASILYSRGEVEAALGLYREKEQLYRELSNLPQLSICLGYKAMMLKKLRKLKEAMTALREQEGICRQLDNIGCLAASLTNQALLFEGTMQVDQGLVLIEKAYRIALEHGDDELAEQIKIKGTVLRSGGR